MISKAPKTDHNQFLVLSSEELDLTESQHNSATEKYRAVGEWLATPRTSLAEYSDVYPQGSLA